MTIDQLNIELTADSKSASSAIDQLTKNLERLKTALGPLANVNVKVSNSFNKATNNITKTSSAMNTYKNAADKATKSTQSLAQRMAQKISTTRTLVSVFQNLANTFADWFNESNEYIETVNLFKVTMGDASGEALEFAENVSKAMGIDVADWMQYQGTFKNLTAGFGVASDKANIMSQNLTQLSYDMASFFNTDVETAFDKLSSAMSGQVKGLREFGIDTTVASLQEYALSKGIDASVRSMSQAEKSLLRYNYIMEKSIIIQGDMARTIITPANSLRILSAQLTQMKRALGNVVSVIVVQFIPYVQALVQIITEAASALATFFGFSAKDFEANTEGIGNGFSSGFEDAEESLDGVSDSIKKIKKQLMGFDELNIISNPTADSGGSDGASGGGAGLNLDPSQYNFLEGLKTEKLDEIKGKLKNALKVAVAIGVVIGAWKVSKGVVTVFNTFSALGGIAKTIGAAVKGSGLVAFFSKLSFAIQAVSGGAATIGEAITYVFSGVTGIVSGLFTAILGGFVYFKNLIDMFKEGENVSNILGAAIGGLTTSVGAFLLAIGLGATAATGGIAALVVAAIAAVGIIAGVVYNHWDEIKAKLGVAWNWFNTTIFTPIKDTLIKVATWFYDNVITPIVDFLTPIFEYIIWKVSYVYGKIVEIVKGIINAISSIVGKVAEIALKIAEIFVALGKAAYTHIIKPVVEFFVSLYQKANEKFFKPFMKAMTSLAEKVTSILKPIVTNVVDFFSGAVKGVLNGVFWLIEKSINGFIKLLNGAIGIINKIPGVNITRVTEISIPRLAEGGIVNEGQMFIAREAGPELVGNIGRKTAVANNDQIISGIESGVYRAMVAANATKQGGSQTIRIINEIDGDIVGEKVIQYHNGKVLQTGVSPLMV